MLAIDVISHHRYCPCDDNNGHVGQKNIGFCLDLYVIENVGDDNGMKYFRDSTRQGQKNKYEKFGT